MAFLIPDEKSAYRIGNQRNQKVERYGIPEYRYASAVGKHNEEVGENPFCK